MWDGGGSIRLAMGMAGGMRGGRGSSMGRGGERSRLWVEVWLTFILILLYYICILCFVLGGSCSAIETSRTCTYPL